MPAIRFIQLILLLALLTTYCLAAPKNAGSKMDKRECSFNLCRILLNSIEIANKGHPMSGNV